MKRLDELKQLITTRWKSFFAWKELRREVLELITLLETLESSAEKLKQESIEAKDVASKEIETARAAVTAKQIAESQESHWRKEYESGQKEIAALVELRNELRISLEGSRSESQRLKDEKHLMEVELEALKKLLEIQRIGNKKLATFIHRRHRPDNLPERLNAITHQNFRQ